MRPVPLAVSAVAAACVLTALGSGCGAFGNSDRGDGDGGSEGDDASAADAGVAVDGGVTPDGDAAGPATLDPGVYCGGAYCDPRTSLCCTTLGSSGGMGCLPKADASVCSGLTHECDDGADCSGGTVCCSTAGSNGKDVFDTSCAPVLDCKKTSFWVVLCDPTAAAPCPDNAACHVPDGGGYGFCTFPQ